MARTDHRSGARRWRSGSVAAVVLAVVLAGCASTTGGTGAATSDTIPPAAFHDTTGLTSTTVSLGNVSTLIGGLFKGAAVGTQAYADYVNASGGIDGRKLVVDSSDDGYSGPNNKQETEAAVSRDFAMVGSFSLQDNFGGQILAQNPSVPNVTVPLDQATNQLPNSFSPQPAAAGWQLGPLQYFKTMFPDKVTKTGVLIANQPSSVEKWLGEKAAMDHLGYHVIYSDEFSIAQSDFNQNVIAMKDAGVRILFLEEMPANYASAVVKALTQQDFHPVVVFGPSTYNNTLIPASGGAAATDGDYLQQADSLFLGGDASSIPAVKTFLTWVGRADPGFSPDLFTLFGWMSAELFTQALKAAGPDPTRGSVLQALRQIHSFNGGNIEATADPASKSPSTCYLIAQVVNGQFQRLDDPPISGPTGGYRCDQPYYYASGT